MIGGTIPKPRDQIRHRVPPRHDWREYPNVANPSPPQLPSSPKRARKPKPPTPSRPLGEAGAQLWTRAWDLSTIPPDEEFLLQLCEQMDERVALRLRVFRDGDWRDRTSLRSLDEQITKGLTKLAKSYAEERPRAWPAPTKKWWQAISRLPHTVDWSEGDWAFAVETAYLVAQFHVGDMSVAGEIRQRQRMMGTTHDARLMLRIRYVDPTPEAGAKANPSVTAMADYRRSIEA